MDVQSLVMLIISALTTIYLFYALLRSEKNFRFSGPDLRGHQTAGNFLARVENHSARTS